MSSLTNHSARCTCGCCDGPAPDVPAHHNAPGLPALRYRLGTHPSFLARMTARLHAWEVLTCAGCAARFVGPHRLAALLAHITKVHPDAPVPADLVVAERPLAALGTRDADDPAVALLDAWAVVGDVVTFYQERLANEHYLRTATERRSVLELARAIGYELDPGVAAETFLAFVVDEAPGAPAEASVPAGTQVLSVPAGGDAPPQTFETAEPLTAHVRRNSLRPRLTHPMVLAGDLTHVYLQGSATGLKAGHVVLFLLDGAPVVRRITRVLPDAGAQHTRIELAGGTAAPAATLAAGPAGALDPALPPQALTRENVRTYVVDQSWDEATLQAFLTVHGWDAETMLGYVDDLRAASYEGADDVLLAFRERLAFFGHNAPRHATLPPLPEDDTLGFTRAALRVEGPTAELADTPTLGLADDLVAPGGGGGGWPYDWDALGLAIWTDSLTNDYYDAPADEPYDVYLERTVAELAANGWTIFERPLDVFAVYRVTDVAEATRSGFGLSTRVSGLRLATPSGVDLSNDAADKPGAFHFRRSTAYAKSEALSLAPLPLTDDLAAGTTALTLGTMVLGLVPGQMVALTGEAVGAGGAVRAELLTLEAVTHASGHTTLTFEEGLVRSYLRATVTLNANVVRASHGETVADEVLGSGDGAARHQRFTLKKPPLTHLAAVGGTETTLTVRVEGVAWTEVERLYGQDAAARVYTVQIDDDARATVVFGDGRSGARLPTGQENVTAAYRSGLGQAGEVGAGSLTLLKTRPYGIRSVTNPLAATGADDPEVLDDARTNAPLTVLTLDRIVSLRDYEDYARAYPGIGKTRATVLWDGTGEVVHVTVADADGDAVVEPLYTRLLASIEAVRDPLRPLVLATYDPLVFFVEAQLLVDAAYRWDDVRAAVEAALLEAFGFTARGFGQPVAASEVLAVMHGVAGVVAVDLDALYATAPDAAPSGSLFNTLLPAQPAQYDRAAGVVRPAQLLLLHPYGITLSEMTP